MLNKCSNGLVRALVLLLCYSAFNPTFVRSQESLVRQELKQKNEPHKAPPELVATVNGEPIYQRQIDFLFAQAVGERNLSKPQVSKTRIAILEKLINQQVVLDYLATFQIKAGPNEIVVRLDELEATLATIDKKLDDHLKQIKLSKTELESLIRWEITWNKYTQQKVMDVQLEAYFKRNRRRFDGTRIRVAHIFLKRQTQRTESSDQEKEIAGQQQAVKNRDKALEAAARIHNEISSGELSWDAALAKHSQAPSRDDDGEIGWIKFDGPMPKPFTLAAFELNTGQLSKPVETSFGIHIIKCVEVEEGNDDWREFAEPLKSDYAKFLFDSIVKQHRPKAKVQIESRGLASANPDSDK